MYPIFYVLLWFDLINVRASPTAAQRAKNEFAARRSPALARRGAMAQAATVDLACT